MAGFLPNVPGVRIPYHRDGTLIKKVNTNGSSAWSQTSSWAAVSSGDAIEMNDGDTTGVAWYSTGTGGVGALWALVFPQSITWLGHNVLFTNTASYVPGGGLYWSSDTIDGTDGIWTYEAMNASSQLTSNSFRSISNVNIPNVKGIRLGGYNNTSNGESCTLIELQLYGQWAPATLAAWHPTLDQQIDGHELDFGDVLLGNVYNKQFRIKNGHTLTANNVTVSCTAGTAEFISGLSFSLDGSTYTSSVTISSIAPGAISGTVYVRRTVSAGQTANILALAPIDFIATTWT